MATIDLTGFQRNVRPFLVAAPAMGLVLGLVAWSLGRPELAAWLWFISTLPVLATLIAEIVSSLARGDFGLDIVAALSMTAALVFGENLAAVVVALMYSGGQYLEAFAEGRARREMTALLSRVPRTAMRYADGGLQQVAVAEIAPKDRLLIRRGDIVPADGVVGEQSAMLDESALTGESLPVRRDKLAPVMSGSTNIGDAFDLVVTHRVAESTYAGIVRLVEQAQQSKAPMARLADRYAMGFLGVTVALAAGAWFFTGDPIRAVAVLVVATPCPLILAVPVALVSGLSLAAKQGILIKGGKALEAMARVSSVVIDKTGTLTEGHPRLVSIEPVAGLTPDELLRLAASLDQASQHTVATTIVAAAAERGLALTLPANVVETPGEGIAGDVGPRRVILGGTHFVAAGLPAGALPAARMTQVPGSIAVAIAVDGSYAGSLILADELRPGTATFLSALRGLGVTHIVLATGDRQDVAAAVTAGLDFDEVSAELAPQDKIGVVIAARAKGPVMMIGDGVNDAPALAVADLGVAMGARGATASAEAADVVLLVDRVDRIVPGIRIARRAQRIAVESVAAGIGLSVAGMVAAAFGYLTPVQGALLQEAIDVAVILNALRALRPPRGVQAAGQAADA